jgi:hypothetical protein
MSPETQLANSASWKALEVFIEGLEQYQDSHWKAWKALGQEFLSACMRLGLDRYYRAGHSMHHLVFSTLDHHPLQEEARVTVELHPEDHTLRIAFGRGGLYFSPAELEYTLSFDAGIPTFQRFLKQLWIATSTEAFPPELNDFSAPILPFPDQQTDISDTTHPFPAIPKDRETGGA